MAAFCRDISNRDKTKVVFISFSKPAVRRLNFPRNIPKKCGAHGPHALLIVCNLPYLCAQEIAPWITGR